MKGTSIFCFTFVSLVKSFVSISGSSMYLINSNLNSKSSITDYLHLEEYPDDDYSHILGYNAKDYIPSKLQIISRDRIKDVILSKAPINTQGCGIDRSFYVSAEDLEEEMVEFDKKYGEPLNIQKCILAKSPQMAIAAEFKRASPSKGDINVNVDCVEQCLEYARIGAAIISVLTEFKHFKGTLKDMKDVRLAVQNELGAHRPAILRKDFIFDKYQLLEARVNGADTVLLIVACLGRNQLKDLINYSRKLKMEPLVEVHTPEEMEIAIECQAKVIGINNRNLHTFQLDLDTTQNALHVAQKKGLNWKYHGSSGSNESGSSSSGSKDSGSSSSGSKDSAYPDLTIVSLSGVTSSNDVQTFQKLGVNGVLVGETLMKAANPRQMIVDLLSTDDQDSETAAGEGGRRSATNIKNNLIKICGFTQIEDIQFALQNKVNLLGLIFVPASPRCVDVTKVSLLTHAIQKYGERTGPIKQLQIEVDLLKSDKLSCKLWYSRCAQLLKKVTVRRPLSVGVFQNQPIEYVNGMVESAGLDLVQLHGNESPEYASRVTVPCIKVIHATTTSDSDSSSSDSSINAMDNHGSMLAEIDSFANIAIACLVDSRVPGSAGGGTGQVFDWSLTQHLDRSFLLAGGLHENNVREAMQLKDIVGIDVSSQIEVSPGVKDLNKLKLLATNARTTSS